VCALHTATGGSESREGSDVGFSSCAAPTYYCKWFLRTKCGLRKSSEKVRENNISPIELSVEVKRELRKLGGVSESGGSSEVRSAEFRVDVNDD